MSLPVHQAHDQPRARTIGVVTAVVVVVLAAVAAISWRLVPVVPRGVAPTRPTSLERGEFVRRPVPAEPPYQWVDRGAGIVRLPVARAIDAVVLDPSLVTR
jgi:hypothetical protein